HPSGFKPALSCDYAPFTSSTQDRRDGGSVALLVPSSRGWWRQPDARTRGAPWRRRRRVRHPMLALDVSRINWRTTVAHLPTEPPTRRTAGRAGPGQAATYCLRSFEAGASIGRNDTTRWRTPSSTDGRFNGSCVTLLYMGLAGGAGGGRTGR